jgi:hypothetical protein
MLRPVAPICERQQSNEDIFSDFPAYSIQRFSVLLSIDNTRAVVEQALPCEIDKPLQEYVKRLREPIAVPSKEFGKLILNKESNVFEGKVNWNTRIIDIYLEKDQDGSVAGAIDAAEQVCRDQIALQRTAEDLAVKKLLPIKNQYWLEKHEKEVDPTSFKALIKVSSLTVSREGHFTLWCDDGGLFWGHLIEIVGNLKDGPTDAAISG